MNVSMLIFYSKIVMACDLEQMSSTCSKRCFLQVSYLFVVGLDLGEPLESLVRLKIMNKMYES